MFSQAKQLVILALVITALAALAIWGAWKKTSPQAVQAIVCADPVAGCTFMHRGLPAQLQFSAQPEALKPFGLAITHADLRQASASFQMTGMNMGFNLYELKPETNGRWGANVTLPVCTASRADWIAELNLDGQLYSLTFTTR